MNSHDSTFFLYILFSRPLSPTLFSAPFYPYTGPSLSSFLLFYSFCWFSVASSEIFTISVSNSQLHYFVPRVSESNDDLYANDLLYRSF